MDLSKIDYPSLKIQKEILIRMIQDWGEATDPIQKQEAEEMEGLLNLLDEIQDNAVSKLGLSEELVFGSKNDRP